MDLNSLRLIRMYTNDPEGFEYFVESRTGVMYVRDPKHGGLTVMLNPKTGLPLTQKAWEEDFNK